MSGVAFFLLLVASWKAGSLVTNGTERRNGESRKAQLGVPFARNGDSMQLLSGWLSVFLFVSRAAVASRKMRRGSCTVRRLLGCCALRSPPPYVFRQKPNGHLRSETAVCVAGGEETFCVNGTALRSSLPFLPISDNSYLQ
ncbi:unnamed protein product, partial [Laminaria digitata]